MPDDSMKVKKINNISMFYLSTGRYDDAEASIKQGLELSEKVNYKKGIAGAYNYRGIICDDKGQMAMALENYFKALKIFEEINHYGGQSDCCNNIGIIYLNQMQLDKALLYFQRSERFAELSKKRFILDNCVNNMGTVYLKKKDFKNALLYYQRAYELRKEFGYTEGCIESLNNLGNLYLVMQDTAEAITTYKEAVDLSIKEKNEKSIAISQYALGYILLKSNFTKGKLLIEEALQIAERINLSEIKRDANHELSDIYLKLKDTNKSYMHYKRFIAARDSFFNEENTKKSVRLEMNYLFEKKEAATTAEQEKKAVVTELESRKQRVVLVLVSFVLILVFVFAVFAYRSNLQKQKTNIELADKNQKIEQAYQVIEVRNKEVLDSIHYAKRIQHALITSDGYLSEHLQDYFIFHKPKDIVSGDFYWASQKENWFYFISADCTGHGVPGAFMSLLNISFLNEAIHATTLTKPNEILGFVRKLIIESLKTDGSEEGGKDGMDCVLCAYNFKENKLLASCSNNPLLIIRNKELLEIKPDKFPVGKHDRDAEPFTLKEISLQKGDIVYTFTDGYADQFGGPKGKKFKYKQLKVTLLDIHHKTMAEQNAILKDTFDSWKKDLEQIDDVLITGIRV